MKKEKENQCVSCLRANNMVTHCKLQPKKDEEFEWFEDKIEDLFEENYNYRPNIGNGSREGAVIMLINTLNGTLLYPCKLNTFNDCPFHKKDLVINRLWHKEPKTKLNIKDV